MSALKSPPLLSKRTQLALAIGMGLLGLGFWILLRVIFSS